MKKNKKSLMNEIELKKEYSPLFEFMLNGTTQPIELRAFDEKGKPKGRLWSRTKDEIVEFCLSHYGHNHTYFGTATRKDGGGKKIDCREVIWLWADIDFKDFTGGEEEARKVLESFKFHPSIVISTGGGLHCYWLLDTVLDAQKDMKLIEQALKILAGELNADPSRTEIASHLRVPGTMNMKPERNEAVCIIESFDLEQMVSLGEILSLDKSTPKSPPISPTTSIKTLREAIAIGNRDVGSLAYINGYIKQNGTATIDSELENEVYALLDQAGGEGLEVIKKKVLGWIKSAHELFDRGKKDTPLELAEKIQNEFDGKLVRVNEKFLRYCEGYWKEITDDQIRRRIAERDKPHTNRERTSNVLQILKDLTDEEALTPEADKLCLLNGTLDLKSGQLAPHSPEFHLMNKLDVEWNSDAKCPLWLKTLNGVFRDDSDKKQKILFLQEWFGYSLIPSTYLHKFLLMVGDGNNGKSLILEVLSAVVGIDNISHAMLDRLNKDSVRAELANKLLNISAEMEDDCHLPCGYIKAISSGDVIEASFKYGRSFSFRPHARLVGATNKLPKLSDLTGGFRRRSIILKFNRKFKPKEEDKHRKSKLMGELSGIFKWSVDGLLRLIEKDNFTTPKSSINALDEYLVDSDPIHQFSAERLAIDKSGKWTGANLYQKYATWATARGFPKHDLNKFGKRLKSLGFEKRKSDGQSFWCVELNEEKSG
jgi:P4 family phage/plasmid primase-like protien